MARLQHVVTARKICRILGLSKILNQGCCLNQIHPVLVIGYGVKIFSVRDARKERMISKVADSAV